MDWDFSLVLGIGLVIAGIYIIYSFSKDSSVDDSSFSENLNEARENIHQQTKLYRKSDEKIISGVCAGLAEYFKIDVSLLRIGMVILGVLTKGILVIAYVLAIFLLPDISKDKGEPEESTTEIIAADELKKDSEDVPEEKNDDSNKENSVKKHCRYIQKQ